MLGPQDTTRASGYTHGEVLYVDTEEWDIDLPKSIRSRLMGKDYPHDQLWDAIASFESLVVVEVTASLKSYDLTPQQVVEATQMASMLL